MIFPRLNCPNPYNPGYKGIRQYDIDLSKVIEILLSNLTNSMEKGIKIDDNVDAVVVSYSSNGVANTEDTIAHTLKRIPIGYIIIKQDKSASFYAGGTAFTTTNIYLKCSTATVAATVLIF